MKINQHLLLFLFFLSGWSSVRLIVDSTNLKYLGYLQLLMFLWLGEQLRFWNPRGLGNEIKKLYYCFKNDERLSVLKRK